MKRLRFLLVAVIVSWFAVSCDDDGFTIETTDATWNGTDAEVAGRIIQVSDRVAEFGVCYSLSTDTPTADESLKVFYVDPKTRRFSITIPNLQQDTLYYVRAYAISTKQKIAYGKPLPLRTY